MKLQQQQRGMTFWSLSFVLFLIGFFAYTLFKVFPVYSNNFSVTSSLESLKEDKSTAHHTAHNVKMALMKRILVNRVDGLTSNDVIVKRDGNLYHIEINYEVVVPYIANVSLLFNFDHKATINSNL